MPPSNSIDRWRYPVSSNSSRAAQSSGSSPSTSRIPAGISVRARRMAGRNCRTNRTSPSEVTGRTAAAPGWRTTSKSWPSQDSTWTRISRPVKASLDDRGCTEAPSAGDGDGALGRGGPTGVRRSHELPEERVRPRGPGPELWMELPPHEERVVRELDDLDQSSVRREPREHQSVLREDLLVVGVDLVAVLMTLVHDLLPVGCRVPGTRWQGCAPRRMDPPRSDTFFCSGKRSITGWRVAGSNSEEFAPSRPHTFLAYSMTAHCRPRHRPRNGTPLSLA